VIEGGNSVLAYIDPATGTMILQIIIASVLGVGVALRRFLMAPFAALAGRFRGRDAGQEDSPTREEAA